MCIRRVLKANKIDGEWRISGLLAYRSDRTKRVTINYLKKMLTYVDEKCCIAIHTVIDSLEENHEKGSARQRIYEYMQTHPQVSLHTLYTVFNIQGATIRMAMCRLEHDGLVRRTGAGVYERRG